MTASEPRESRVLQRVVFPADQNLDIVPLYVETRTERGADLAGGEATVRASAAVGDTHAAVRFDSATETGEAARRSATIAPRQRVSFATYFNAFPAGYWRRWTRVETVTLHLLLSGPATVIVYRSSAKGRSHPVESVTVDGPDPELVEVTLPLTQFIDGGWYWFDIAAGRSEVRLVEASWTSVVPADRRAGRVSIGITTFNRPDFLVELLRSIGDSSEVVDRLDRIYVIDQGTDRVRAHVDFVAATKGIDDKLEVIEQGNLGGSGGFSRAMDETLTAGASDYLILLDDDVVLEPEGILRAATFADLARRPTVVGAHMFSLYDRSVLHAFGETVAPYTWWWGAAPTTEVEHDFGRQSLRHTPWLHRRVDVDYNGWWMCLIPTEVIRELGLALPVFIKWDDAEYGLRARAAGYPTVSLPGAAVWHVPWHDKTDAVDWQAYFHVRNRLLTALLHSPYDRGGRVVGESFEIQIQHLLSMQYSTAELRLLAIEDLLSGPGHLHRDLAVKTGQLRELRARYPDAQGATDVEAFPPVRRRRPPARGKQYMSPRNQLGLVTKVAKGAVRQLRPVPRAAAERPLAAVAHQDASWWTLANIDSAIVSAADGAGAAWYRRNPGVFRSQLVRSAALHSRLLREWPALRTQYRTAAPEFTSRTQWRETFQGRAEGGSGGGR